MKNALILHGTDFSKEQKPEPVKEEKQPESVIPEPEINVKEEVKKQLDEKVSELLKKANEKRK